MRDKIRYYSVLYKEFITMSLAQAMEFRLHFILIILMDVFFYFSSLKSIDFIYDYVDTIGGLSRYEFLFFVSFMLAIDQLHMTILSESFWRFSADLKTGQLDYTLLRPASTMFQVFLRYFRPSSFLNCFVTGSFLVYYGSILNFSMIHWILLPFFIATSFTLLAFLEILVSCLMFWTIEGIGINFLRMELQRVSRWPDFIYYKPVRVFLMTALPILIIGNAPVNVLFLIKKMLLSGTSVDSTDFKDLIFWISSFILVTTLFVNLSLRVWQYALKRYESASS